MKESQNIEQSILAISCHLREALASHVNDWQWDERHQAIQTAFSVDHQQAVEAILVEHFSDQWQGRAFAKESSELKHLAGHFAKLEKNQKIYTDKSNPTWFAVWWPWGHGATVSVRLFLANPIPYQTPRGWLAKLKQRFA